MAQTNELTLQDIATFYGCGLRTAQDRAKEIKAFFELSRKKRILKFHLAKYEGLTLSDLDIILTNLN